MMGRSRWNNKIKVNKMKGGNDASNDRVFVHNMNMIFTVCILCVKK
jgi:hypothetical protein